MTDIVGQVVLSSSGVTTEGINVIEMDLSTAGKGVYMISIMSNGNTSQLRTIVE